MHTILHWLVSAAFAIVLHEAAHVVVALANGLTVRRIGFSWIGPYVVRERSQSAAVNAAVSLAGPAMNLVLAFVFWFIAPQFAQVNLEFTIISGLPWFPASDGKAALRAVRGKLGQPSKERRPRAD